MTTGVDSSVFEPYCKNDMRLLRSISKSIFLRLGESLTEAEYDDFYSIANITLFQAVRIACTIYFDKDLQKLIRLLKREVA